MTPLTAREQAVLHAISNGKTDRQIAATCYVSLSTVTKDITHLCEKLGARNRTHAVAIAYRAGLLPVAVEAA